MKTDPYYGWSNWSTWNVALWLDNDEGSYSYCQDMAQAAYDGAEGDGTFTREEQAAFSLATGIKELFEEDAQQGPQSGWMADAVNAYMGEVNWHEIAKHYINDVEKEEAGHAN